MDLTESLVIRNLRMVLAGGAVGCESEFKMGFGRRKQWAVRETQTRVVVCGCEGVGCDKELNQRLITSRIMA